MKKHLAKLRKKEKPKIIEEEELPIITLEDACPVCGSDIRGNKKVLFYCKQCNILFREADIRMQI